jgi:Ca2+/Na+ antiporter
MRVEIAMGEAIGRGIGSYLGFLVSGIVEILIVVAPIIALIAFITHRHQKGKMLRCSSSGAWGMNLFDAVVIIIFVLVLIKWLPW